MLFAIAAAGAACATEYTLPNANAAVVGEDQTVVTVYEDTLYDLAAKYSLGSEELIRVNPGVDPWMPGAGKTLVVPGRHILPPGPREGIVVNLPEHRLYYYPKPKRGGPSRSSPIPSASARWIGARRSGVTHVIQKQKNPIWYPPESVRKEHAAAGDPLAGERTAGTRQSARRVRHAAGRRQGYLPDSRHEQSDRRRASP